MEIKVTVTIGDLLRKYDWLKACEVLGFCEWCVNEGTADPDEEITLTQEQAEEIGVLKT